MISFMSRGVALVIINSSVACLHALTYLHHTLKSVLLSVTYIAYEEVSGWSQKIDKLSLEHSGSVAHYNKKSIYASLH